MNWKCPILVVYKEREVYWGHFLEKRRLRIRRSRKQRDRCWPPIGHKNIFCTQLETSIPMSRGTGLLRVASQRLSRPFLKTSTTASFPDPNDLPWVTKNGWISVPSQWFQVLVPCYSLQLIPVQTVPKCSTEPIPYATLQWFKINAAQLHSAAEIAPK